MFAPGQHTERVTFTIKEDRIKNTNRITGLCRITFPSGRETLLDCRLDTGSDFTLVPQSRWMRYMTDEDKKNCGTGTVNGVGGEISALRTNLKVTILGADLASSYELDSCPVLLACDEDADGENPESQPPFETLLGIGGVLDRGGLCINWKDKKAHLIEVHDAR